MLFAPDRLTTIQSVPSAGELEFPDDASTEVLAHDIDRSADSDVFTGIRGARPEDVDALAQIELLSYVDVYGQQPDAEVIADARQKYAERVEFLGDWIRVVEDEDGVYGMLVCCPTSLAKEDFIADGRDMTQNATIQDVFDPQGQNAYIVNLAIKPDRQGNEKHIALFLDALKLGASHGIRNAYFESRMPGFERWATKRYQQAYYEDTPQPLVEDLAEEYWLLNREDGLPIDPLLRKYAKFGATPLKLVKDAWKPDLSSKGYGVLFELGVPELPQEEGSATVAPTAENEVIGIPEAVGENVNSLRRIANWAKAHKKGLLIGASAAAAISYTLLSSQKNQIIQQIRDTLPWAGPAWLTAMGIWAVGGLMMAVGAGMGASKAFRSASGDSEALNAALQSPDHQAHMRLIRAGYWMNMIGGLAAAAVSGTAVIEALPPAAAAGPLTVVGADIYQTIAVRNLLYRKIYPPKD